MAIAPASPKQAGGLRLSARRAVTAWIFLAPMLAVLALVAGWPLLRTILVSLTDAQLGDFTTANFIGLGNYATLVQDPGWWRAVGNTLLFTVVSVSLETVLSLVIALTLNAHIPGRGLLRAAVLIPWAIPTVVSAKMWGWMFHDLYGVVNALLLALGLIAKPWAWLADPVLSMIAVIAVDVWKGTPFMALLSLAALQVLPQEIYEAARIDGVGPLKVFFRVTLPLIRPALLVAIIFRGLDALRVFDVIYVLTGNNAATASMSIYARQQLIEFQDAGYGSAAATFLFLIVALLAALVVTTGRIRITGRAAA
ncbi:MAG TPA: sugar ABC transporter permease [Dongiaceae bacterium]